MSRNGLARGAPTTTSTSPTRRKGFAGLLDALSEARGLARFAGGSPQASKQEARVNWTAVPAGTDAARAAHLTREYFEEVERYRYRTQPWTAAAIDRLELSGRRVLEIGFGAGTDHLRMARRGARLTGVDLTPQSFVETARRFEHDGRRAELVRADMEALPLRDATFDLVYAFGSIHHTPDCDRALREIARVLKPGGGAWLAVYHRSSIFFWWSVFGYRFLLRGGFRHRTLRSTLSRVEHPGTNEGLVVLLHSRRELEDRLRSAGLAVSRSYVTHLVPGDVAGLDILLPEPERPRAWLSWLGRFWGWYVVVEAKRRP